MRLTRIVRPHAALGLLLGAAACGLAARLLAEGPAGPVFPAVEGLPPVVEGTLPWTALEDVAHLEREVAAATKAGKAVVVDVWATWCTYCMKYATLIEGDPELRAAFSRLVRLRLDVTEDPRKEMRAALGMESGQPRMVFLDRQGRLLRGADIHQWYVGESASQLRRSVLLALAGGPVGPRWTSADAR